VKVTGSEYSSAGSDALLPRTVHQAKTSCKSGAIHTRGAARRTLAGYAPLLGTKVRYGYTALIGTLAYANEDTHGKWGTA
jgi:hypothetical protein